MSSTPDTPARPFPWFTAFLVVATIGLSVLVFVLSNENRRLRGLLDDKYAEALKASLQVGESLGTIELVGASGTQTTHDFAAHPATLVLVISTHCPHCDEALPTWVRAVEDARATRVPVVCIESDVIAADQLKPTPPTIPAFFVPNARSTWLTRLSMVPAAILVGNDAKVIRTWYGPLSPKDQDAMTDALMAAAAPSPGQK